MNPVSMLNKFEISLCKDETLATLLRIEDDLLSLHEFDSSLYDKNHTAIIFMDVLSGFVTEGNLSSDRALVILDALKTLDEQTEGFSKVYFADHHTKDSVEFGAYPPHCIVGTPETEFAIKFDTDHPKSIIVAKNSVNGFLAPAFSEWLALHDHIKNFIVVGLVTDICVMNFSLTLKAYLNQWNIHASVIIPMSMIETFDLPATNHLAPLMNLFALYNMKMNGIILTK